MSQPNSHDFRDTLYTIDKTGHRKWVYPNTIKGQWFSRRVIVAYCLMAFYLIMPWIEINNLQGIWLDFANRRFIFFGTVFWATDTKFVVFTLAGLGISLFFFTALFGRVWCGWACPETVFLEFLFRPIERLIEGNGAQRLKLDQSPWNFQKIFKKLLKHGICALSAWVIANTALAYIVGKEPLIKMMTDYPWNNPVPFTVSLVLMGLMAFQFGWFREQFCTVVCPYARFQSVLLDPHSLVVSYDSIRGEPRGKAGKNKTDNVGDCVDCGLCVRVCPTGIDIRNGIQLECIHCTACIDACDSVMKNLGRAPGLIRYETEAGLQGQTKHFVRPRVVVYATLLLVIFSAFTYSLKVRSFTELRIVRGARDVPFTVMPDGQITNHLHAKVSNKGDKLQSFVFSIADSKGINLVTPLNPFNVEPESIATAPLFFTFDIQLLVNGKKSVTVEIVDQNGEKQEQTVILLGPTNND